MTKSQMVKTLTRIMEQDDHQSMLTVSHGGTCLNFLRAVRRLSDTICIENGYSIVENPKPHGKSYNKWLGDQAKPSHRDCGAANTDHQLCQDPRGI